MLKFEKLHHDLYKFEQQDRETYEDKEDITK
jgi:hypothetical protein